MVKQISVQQLNEKLEGTQKFRLIDCREPDEYELCRIEGATLVPLSKFPEEAPKQLKKDEEIVIHCHHGGRSQQACEFLEGQGYTNVSNLAGGIHAWSVEIDPDVQQY